MTFLIFYKTENKKLTDKPKVINLNNSIEIIFSKFNEDELLILMNDNENRIIKSKNPEVVFNHIIERLNQNKTVIDIRRFQKGDNE